MKNSGSFTQLKNTVLLLRIILLGSMLLVVLTVWAGWGQARPFLLLLLLIPLLLRLLVDRTGDFLGSFLMEGCRTPNQREQLSGELVKARRLKADRRFDEALAGANFVLSKLPDHPEALFLKAQILCEGFESYAAASACLKKIAVVQPPADEATRTWAATLLQEIREKLRSR